MTAAIRTTLRMFGWALIVSGFVFAGAAMWLAYSYQHDANFLRAQARAVTALTSSVGRRVEVLNTWVYRNKGFAKNQHYFWISRLGPTPIDVLEAGGDCADKSRLLSAMLREIGIQSSLAMLYPCPDCGPVHTVVLARSEEGWIAADPVYDVTFPDKAGGYRTVANLTSDDNALTERLAQLKVERGRSDKINAYDSATHHYRYLTTINWNKNVALRLTANVLKSLGYEPQTLPRPQLLEDPKYALTWFFASLSFALIVVGAVLVLVAVRTTRRSGTAGG